MIRSPRAMHPATAAQLRLVAFVTAAASVLVIPAKFASAALGHDSAHHAFVWAAVAAAATVAMAFVARGLDPLRRR